MRLIAFLLVITKIFIFLNIYWLANAAAAFNGRYDNDATASFKWTSQLDNLDSRPDSVSQGQQDVIRASVKAPLEEHQASNHHQHRHHYRRHRQLETDDQIHRNLAHDNALDSTNNKSNSLIEWPQNISPSSPSEYKLQQFRKHSQNSGQSFSTSSSLALLDPYNNEGMHLKHRNHWCNRECSNGPNQDRNRVICASNGHIYESICELKRYSCRNNVPLFRRPKTYCSPKSIHQNESVDANAAEKVRFIELKFQCSQQEFDEMKLLLLQEFNGDITSMFRYFDSNGDQFIEAHELWPRRADETTKRVYAQVWSNHSSECKHHHQPRPRHIFARDQSKCWFYLDFAFEPQFQTNPCSLSHLMLFELQHPTHKFTPETFEQAFKDTKTQFYSIQNQLNRDPIRWKSQLRVGLGDSVSLSCIQNTSGFNLLEENNVLRNESNSIDSGSNGLKCLWTRYNLNLAAVQSSRIFLTSKALTLKNGENLHDLTLNLKDAQLYISGQFKCVCHIKKSARNFEHLYMIQVQAEPRVTMRPNYQWSLPNSRVSFECNYDYIDTSASEETEMDSRRETYKNMLLLNDTNYLDNGHFGLKVKWFKRDEQLTIDGKKTTTESPPSWERTISEQKNATVLTEAEDFLESVEDSRDEQAYPEGSSKLSPTSSRVTLSLASSKITLERLQFNDSGRYTCRVEVPNRVRSSPAIYGENQGTLLVQEHPKSLRMGELDSPKESSCLWMFHDNGISIYRLQNDDSQEMELVREINGHSIVSGEVDGNWNQLTLCGGLNPEQIVICEWSDNALHIDVDGGDRSEIRRYIYVGQPNLNRVIVMDGSKFEIVAIINTEPQPRKLHLFKPNKIHLSKWVRRRLSPAANAHWKSLVETQAHPINLTPNDSRLYSSEPSKEENIKLGKELGTKRVRYSRESGINRVSSSLQQFDIWLLCYGQPFVVDPSGDEHLGDTSEFFSQSSITSNNITDSNHKQRAAANTVLPFTPRLSSGPPFAWPAWSNKESKLRNRKSVHIIQSTFLRQHPGGLHSHEEDSEEEMQQSQLDQGRRPRNGTVVGDFKRSTVLTTHHVFAGIPSGSEKSQQQYHTRAPHFDLIQDLFVPSKPYSLENNVKHKLHYAYVTHYDERRLFRVSMDEYRYDREIDLQNCDPINLMSTAQGLLIFQCRVPITHHLNGQLVLDQLSNSRIEFNANIRAQESYLSPDSRYLVSIYNNSTIPASFYSEHSSRTNSDNEGDKRGSSTERASKREQSIVYVQLVTVLGLKLQYEIKTSLEINQCSFVWKDGYYAAILVSTNRRDQQSEILSLRLADSRLELTARVPGLISETRHKNQLIVSAQLRMAALSTNQGTYVVDLEDNRVSQSLRYHQSPPTLLWV